MPWKSAIVYLGIYSLLFNISLSLRQGDQLSWLAHDFLILALKLPNPGKIQSQANWEALVTLRLVTH